MERDLGRHAPHLARVSDRWGDRRGSGLRAPRRGGVQLQARLPPIRRFGAGQRFAALVQPTLKSVYCWKNQRFSRFAPVRLAHTGAEGKDLVRRARYPV